MKKELVLIGTLALLLTVWFSGCNQESETISSERDRFIGSWQNTTTDYTQTMTLFSNGTCTFFGQTGIWELQEGKLVINLTSIGLLSTYIYTFSNNDNTLTLTFTGNNYTEVWTRL